MAFSWSQLKLPKVALIDPWQLLGLGGCLLGILVLEEWPTVVLLWERFRQW